MTTLRVRDARKRFADVTALDGVSLELGRGELLALLGPNGAGKTTLVRAIAGRVRLDGGTVELLGEPMRAGAPRTALGVVPQEIAVYPLLTARENLQVFGRLHGVDRAALDDAVAWALDWTGLAPRADEPTERFSGGMRRRLNIACGVLHRPEVILLDEPTVGVDPQSRERIYEMLALLRGDGASLLLTTHQLEEAEARCDRIVIIDHGTVVASGTLGELTARAFGSDHRVTFEVDRLPAELPAGVEPGGNGHVLKAAIGDVAADLPEMVRRLADAGATVEGLDVRRPGLADVFIHLTGRELRE